jgi:hypothetical protein
MRTRIRVLLAACSFCALCASGTVQAQSALPIPAPAPKLLPSEQASPAPFAAAPVADGALHRIAGREDLSLVATSQQVAGVSRNSVGDNSNTGQVAIGDNAFQNLSGLALVNVNTGNNVAINSAMNVSIAIAPTP